MPTSLGRAGVPELDAKRPQAKGFYGPTAFRKYPGLLSVLDEDGSTRALGSVGWCTASSPGGCSGERGLRRAERRQVEDLFLLEPKNQAKQTARPRWLRHRAIVLTFIYVGLRLNELFNVKISDVTLGEKSGTIGIPMGKGRKERYARIPREARQALKEWLACGECGCIARMTRCLSRSEMGKRTHMNLLASGLCRQLLPMWVNVPAFLIFPLTSCVTPRSEFWRKRVNDDRVVAAQMGHSIATMMKYDAISDADLDRGLLWLTSQMGRMIDRYFVLFFR